MHTSIERHSSADMQGALDHWKLLEAFDVIQHAAVLRGKLL
jgi:hypothetical protein